MQRYTIVLFLLFVSLHLQAKECIGFITAGSAQRVFWSEMIKGGLTAANELNLDLYFRGPSRDTEENSQKLIIDYLIKTYHCPGIVLAPAGKSLKKTVQELARNGITVTYIDRDVGGNRASIVKSNNYSAGVLAAQKMAQALGNKKNIALVRIKQGIQSTDDRERGFVEEAQKLGLKIVWDNYAGVTVGETRSRTMGILTSVSDVDGIFTPTGISTEGFLKALEGKHITSLPVHIGFDGSEYIDQKIRERKLYGYIKQDPFRIGYLGVHSLYKIMNGDKNQTQVDVPVIFISEKTLDQE